MKIRPVVLLNNSTLPGRPQNPVMTNSTNQETITFYDVPLVCGAAPSIGCGIRAKPLLIDLEQQAQSYRAYWPTQLLPIRPKGECTSLSLRAVTWR
jgi:hypothetical protein